MTSPKRTSPDAARDALVARVRAMTPHLLEDDAAVSDIVGGAEAAGTALQAIDAPAYGRSRNHLDGAVTRLSPFIRHGVLSLAHVRDHVLRSVEYKRDAEKLVQQLAWRDYWQRIHAKQPEHIWEDLEPYKTGFAAESYAAEMPDDILRAESDSAAINHFLRELYDTGWLHNHARLYVAAYVCHFRRVRWQAGARLFLAHLLDGDVASNNLSWQWVASTFSHKPYYFNLENLQSFCGDDIDTSYRNNRELAGSYEALHSRLFPLLPPQAPRVRGNKDQKPKGRRKRAHHHD